MPEGDEMGLAHPAEFGIQSAFWTAVSGVLLMFIGLVLFANGHHIEALFAIPFGFATLLAAGVDD